MLEQEEYMKIALIEAKKARKNEDVPVGAIVVRSNKIISKGYNKKEKNKNSILHAEIIAINKACKKLKTWRLDDCEIYITLEPCMMCTGAINQSRIKRVFYGSKNEKFGYIDQFDKNKINSNHFPDVVGGILEIETTKLIKDFFKEKR